MHDSNNIRNIVKEITRVLNSKNVQVSENVLMYYVQLLSLNPAWGISGEALTDRDHIHTFIMFVVNQLENQNHPSFLTLIMQTKFSYFFNRRERLVNEDRAKLVNKLLPLKTDILKQERLDFTSMVEKMFKKIIYYITLVSGFGNPGLDPVYEEALMALKSILNEDELKAFIHEPKKEKEAHLDQLVKLVVGIRLFNKECGKGGEGMKDLPALLSMSYGIILTYAQSMLLNVMDKVNIFTTIIDKSYIFEATEIDFQIICKLPENVTENDIEYVKDLLIIHRQCEVCLRKTIVELEKLEENSRENFMELEESLKKVHDIVYMKIAILANIIFPHFENLSNIWTKIQRDIMLVCRLNEILESLAGQLASLLIDFDIIESMLGDEEPLTDAERLEKTADLSLPPSYNGEVAVLKSDYFPDIDKVQIEYLGFCCFKLVQTKGGLIPGNPSMGIAQYNSKNFVFSIPEAAEQFYKNPKAYMYQILNLVRQKPHLVNFLQVRDQLLQVKNVEQLIEVVLDAPLVNATASQTETHPISSRIDKDYKWNVWDLKRDALKLADLTKCKTISTQTDKVFSRCPVGTQTYSAKDQNMQTKTDNYTNVPKPSNFIFGLRGRKDDKQFIVNLTRPVDE